MLGHLGANAPRLIRPYMEPVLNVSKKSFRLKLFAFNSSFKIRHPALEQSCCIVKKNDKTIRILMVRTFFILLISK